MDANSFDRVVRTMRTGISRRSVGGLLAGSTISCLFGGKAQRANAKNKKKTKKKVTLCHEGQTIAVSKKAKKKHLAHGDTLGECVPQSASTTTTTTTTTPAPGPNPVCLGPHDTGVAGVRRVALTFVAQRTGQLAAAECRLGSTNGGEDFTVEIRAVDSAGVPTTTVLASDTIADFSKVPSSTPLTAIFDPPAAVQTGVRYAFVVTAGPNQGVFVLTRSGNPCPGHDLFIDTAATNNFSLEDDLDMLFIASIVT